MFESETRPDQPPAERPDSDPPRWLRWAALWVWAAVLIGCAASRSVSMPKARLFLGLAAFPLLWIELALPSQNRLALFGTHLLLFAGAAWWAVLPQSGGFSTLFKHAAALAVFWSAAGLSSRAMAQFLVRFAEPRDRGLWRLAWAFFLAGFVVVGFGNAQFSRSLINKFWRPDLPLTPDYRQMAIFAAAMLAVSVASAPWFIDKRRLPETASRLAPLVWVGFNLLLAVWAFHNGARTEWMVRLGSAGSAAALLAGGKKEAFARFRLRETAAHDRAERLKSGRN